MLRFTSGRYPQKFHYRSRRSLSRRRLSLFDLSDAIDFRVIRAVAIDAIARRQIVGQAVMIVRDVYVLAYLAHELRLLENFGVFDSHVVDTRVEEQHHDKRNKEWPTGWVDHVPLSGRQLALVIPMRHVPLPPEQRRDGDGDRQAPHERDHDARALGRADAPVLERPADGQVAVPADGDQVQDGRRAAEHVQGAPEHAHLAAEHPDSQQFLHGREREHEPAEEQVGHGEGDDEIVGGRA